MFKTEVVFNKVTVRFKFQIFKYFFENSRLRYRRPKQSLKTVNEIIRVHIQDNTQHDNQVSEDSSRVLNATVRLSRQQLGSSRRLLGLSKLQFVFKTTIGFFKPTIRFLKMIGCSKYGRQVFVYLFIFDLIIICAVEIIYKIR